MLLLGVRSELTRVHSAFADPRVRWRLCASAALVSVNWLTYVWAIGNQRVVESSLGYFINPLLNVVLRVVVLSEGQARAMDRDCGDGGVLWLAWSAGHPPWIAVALALTFGLYGLVRKTVPVDALPGFAAETLLLQPTTLAHPRLFDALHVGLHARVPIGLGQRRAFSGLSGQAFPCAGGVGRLLGGHLRGRG